MYHLVRTPFPFFLNINQSKKPGERKLQTLKTTKDTKCTAHGLAMMSFGFRPRCGVAKSYPYAYHARLLKQLLKSLQSMYSFVSDYRLIQALAAN